MGRREWPAPEGRMAPPRCFHFRSTPKLPKIQTSTVPRRNPPGHNTIRVTRYSTTNRNAGAIAARSAFLLQASHAIPAASDRTTAGASSNVIVANANTIAPAYKTHGLRDRQ